MRCPRAASHLDSLSSKGTRLPRQQVLIADMPNYNGQDRRDVLIRQIREAIAEDNRKEIIERLLKGRQERVRKGLFPGGTLPYGYKREGKKLLFNPVEVAAVVDVFRMKEQGKTLTEIARALDAKGLRLRNGGPWTVRQVLSILAHRDFYEEGRIHYGSASTPIQNSFC